MTSRYDIALGKKPCVSDDSGASHVEMEALACIRTSETTVVEAGILGCSVLNTQKVAV